MSDPILVHVDLRGTPHLVGRLWPQAHRRQESATFQYDAAWLVHPERFAIEPALTLDAAAFHSAAERPLFGALGDSAPDRWGRALLAQRERHRARAAGTAPRALRELDYLLGVADVTRLGALRFRATASGPFLADPGPEAEAAPPLVELRRLLRAAGQVEDGAPDEAALRLLLAPGSSLGGARPKASVREPDGRLAIAKFPSRRDDWDIVRWEAVALTLAERAGIPVAPFRIASVSGRPVLVLSRFDRRGTERVPFLSAMSLLGTSPGEASCYPDIADALRRYGAAALEDLRQLWRRMAFTVLVSNTDDHLRNHGVLYDGPRGWRLSPAYDLNPTPQDVRPRVLATAITPDGDATASLDAVLSVGNHFALNHRAATRVVREVGAVVATWRTVAKRHGVPAREVDRMASAFEHADLRAALARA